MGEKIERVFDAPVSFASVDGTQHPASVWEQWTSVEWALFFPDWRLLPVQDMPPGPDAAVDWVRRAETDWTVADDHVRVRYVSVARPPAVAEAALTAARMEAVTANNAAAGRAREAYLTAVPGQSTTYVAPRYTSTAIELEGYTE